MRHAASQWLRFIRSVVPIDPSVSCSLETSDMSAEEAMVGSASGTPQAAAAASPAAAKAPPQGKKASRPKIDLDEEIRRANDVAAMSRKMLQAAKSVSRNNRKAKQRLIKKAGKLSPEDLERIAVLKRCGMYEEDGEEEQTENGEAEDHANAGEKKRPAGPSAAEMKRPKLSKSLETLTAEHPILGEIGAGSLGGSSSSAASSSSRFNAKAAAKKKGLSFYPLVHDFSALRQVCRTRRTRRLTRTSSEQVQHS